MDYRLRAAGGGSTVRDLVIDRFSGSGIDLNASDNAIVGNFIGTDISGDNLRNGGAGISIGSNASNNTIGGTEAGGGQRNLGQCRRRHRPIEQRQHRSG